MPEKSLIVIMWDQLSLELASLQAANQAKDVVLLVEASEEATYVSHHKKKLAFLFSAMRHFAQELSAAGWTVVYIKLDDPENTGSLIKETKSAVIDHNCDQIVVTEPGDWRLYKRFQDLNGQASVPVKILADARFLCSRKEFHEWADGRKQIRMENFYRDMRRKTGLLLKDEKPEGGKWNFDKENRKPGFEGLEFLGPKHFEPDIITREVLDLVSKNFPENFGDLEPFWFAVTRHEAEQALQHFIDNSLKLFGPYQDALMKDEAFLFHSVISLYINIGLLDSIEVCQKIESEYRKGRVPLNSAEGFIRQIIGWREFVRGIYWLKMPDYSSLNFFENSEKLPKFYWSGETPMACLRASLKQTKEEAYAHHIQRLMITGNFAMLAGVDPKEVHEWYLAVYIDAHEWVELPNTLGMSQFADGGVLGSKPYAASGNYIKKMSNYCKSCKYDVQKKVGEDACPFNYLYWDFLARNKEKLKNNRRLSMVYRIWGGMDKQDKDNVRKTASWFLSQEL